MVRQSLCYAFLWYGTYHTTILLLKSRPTCVFWRICFNIRRTSSNCVTDVNNILFIPSDELVSWKSMTSDAVSASTAAAAAAEKDHQRAFVLCEFCCAPLLRVAVVYEPAWQRSTTDRTTIRRTGWSSLGRQTTRSKDAVPWWHMLFVVSFLAVVFWHNDGICTISSDRGNLFLLFDTSTSSIAFSTWQEVMCTQSWWACNGLLLMVIKSRSLYIFAVEECSWRLYWWCYSSQNCLLRQTVNAISELFI